MKEEVRLFNTDKEDINMLFEQYKLYVEQANNISERRATANNFFLTTQTAIVTLPNVFEHYNGLRVLYVAGIMLAVLWFFVILNYKNLNSAKYDVIGELEQKLPAMPYNYEWQKLQKGTNNSKYWPLSHIERIVPWVFVVCYILLLIFK
ncbi:MAG: hypothetical protein K6G73_05795 [Marinilabiliaceae bacterium]|nr:hypothetical protein [Marinilabiliaceae bacterium]